MALRWCTKNIENYDLDKRIAYILQTTMIIGVAEYDTIFLFIEQFVVGFIARTYYYCTYERQQLIEDKEKWKETKKENMKEVQIQQIRIFIHKFIKHLSKWMTKKNILTKILNFHSIEISFFFFLFSAFRIYMFLLTFSHCAVRCLQGYYVRTWIQRMYSLAQHISMNP